MDTRTTSGVSSKHTVLSQLSVSAQAFVMVLVSSHELSVEQSVRRVATPGEGHRRGNRQLKFSDGFRAPPLRYHRNFSLDSTQVVTSPDIKILCSLSCTAMIYLTYLSLTTNCHWSPLDLIYCSSFNYVVYRTSPCRLINFDFSKQFLAEGEQKCRNAGSKDSKTTTFF